MHHPLPPSPAAEVQRLKVWADPLEDLAKASEVAACDAAGWRRHVDAAWGVSPQLALALSVRLNPPRPMQQAGP